MEATASGECCGTCGCAKAVAVAPRIDERVWDFLSEATRLDALLECHGSPLNIVFPRMLAENLEAFRAALRTRSLPGAVHYTTKPNKSPAFVREAALRGASADVSSERAMARALSCGIPGSRIHATGPKTDGYLFLALRQGALISVDSIDELRRLIELAAVLGERPRVLLRLAGFRSTRQTFSPLATSLGISRDGFNAALALIEEHRDAISLSGISHHLFNPGLDERIVALEDSVECMLALQRRGFPARILNIGGGFPICYADSSEQWSNFLLFLKRTLTGQASPITWQGSGLGFRAEQGRAAGSPQFLEHFVAVPGARALEALLDAKAPAYRGSTIASLLLDLEIELHVEPGRALLDQAGVTAARVLASKRSATGERVVQLEMNHSHLRSNEQKLLTQPLFFSARPAPQTTCEGVYLLGNLCTGNDVISYQKVFPGFEPERGDVVVFINTAAYLSDFSESETLEHRLAEKIAAVPGAAHGVWRCMRDASYFPLGEQEAAV